MPSLLRIILHPIVPVSVGDNDTHASLDAAVLLSLFCGAGIWLVYQRYQRMHNSPLPFEHRAPLVRILPSMHPCIHQSIRF